jgi:uncharacterized protein
VLPMFPLSTVLFPGAVIPLHIFEERYRALTKDCLAGDARFGIVLIERGIETGGGDQRASVGTVVRILQAQELDDGRWLMLAQGEAPVGIDSWLPDAPYPLATVRPLPVEGAARAGAGAGAGAVPVDPALLQEAEVRLRRTRGLLSESGASAPMSPGFRMDDNPELAVWQLCAEAPVSAYDAQRLLSADGVARRLALLLSLTEEIEEDVRRLMSGG